MVQTRRYFFGYTLLLAVLLILSSCSDNSSGPEEEESNLTDNQKAAVSYFKEVALGFEFGNAPDVTRKWDRDITIYVGGEEDQALLDELDDIITELNDLISRDDIELSITSDSTSSNYYIFFGTGQEFVEVYPNAEGYTETNFGLFFVSWNSAKYLNRGTMYVDTERPAPQNQLHLLREELTQSLGMAQDSPRYTDSIFQASYNDGVATEYSIYDKAVIQMLYHPQMQTGLNAAQVDPILREIVVEVIE